MSAGQRAAAGAPGDPAVDGRRARGDRRRELLVDAAIDVIAAGGAGAVTHRAVAAASGIPRASVAYYFPRVDDVLVAALTRAADRYERIAGELGAAVSAGTDPVDAIVDGVRAWHVLPGDATAAAEYELYLLAARRPEFAPIALRWADRLTGVLTDAGVDRIAARAIVALVEGVVLQGLLGRETPAPDLRAGLRRLLGPG